MLLSDADRELLFTRLKANAAVGAISLEELERRVEVVARAQTREEASAAVADLPVTSAVTEGAGAEAPARARGRRGYAQVDRPGPDWQATPERFRDPRSGQIMRVWEDPSGQRHYVPES